MPNVSFVITRAVQKWWGEYWKSRPNDVPLDLAETLVNSTVVEDYSAVVRKPEREGDQFWKHPQIPGLVFVVANNNGVEYVVIGMVREKPNWNPKVKVNPPDPPAVHEPVPQIGVEPDAGPSERWAWCVRSSDAVAAWLGRASKGHPDRAGVVDVFNKLMKRRKAMRLEVERIKQDAMDTQTRDELFEVDGKIMCVPAVRWLLSEVKALRERVAAMEAEQSGRVLCK